MARLRVLVPRIVGWKRPLAVEAAPGPRRVAREGSRRWRTRWIVGRPAAGMTDTNPHAIARRSLISYAYQTSPTSPRLSFSLTITAVIQV